MRPQASFRRFSRLATGLGLACLVLLTACVPRPAAPQPTTAPLAPPASASPPATQSPVETQPTAEAQVSSSPAQPLRTWTVAAGDGAVFVIDAMQRLFRLAPGTLAVERVSAPLWDGVPSAPIHLAEAAPYLVASNESVTRTLVLDRAGFQQLAAWDRAGPVAVDPGRRLFMASERGLWAYDLAGLGQPPVTVEPASPPGLGSVPLGLAADPATRQLFATYHHVDASPPHQQEFYRVYNLDAPAQTRVLDSYLGALSRPAFASKAGRVVGIVNAKNGFLGSRLLIYDGLAPKARTGPAPLDGVPVVDTTGAWIYLLRERGLWVLDGKTLALQSVLPFTTAPPADLALAPDGGTLYFFGNGWLSAQPTSSLQGLGIAPVTGGFPKAWTYPDLTPAFQPRAYPSPNFAEDGTAFVLAGGYGETYRTTDHGQTWQFLPTLTYPELHYVQYLSLSPQFARDHTLTAHSSGDRPILRSTDGGSTWQPWTPRIAFASDRDGTRQVYTANSDGSDARRVTAGPGKNENPAWSPAWTYIAFQTARAGNPDIYAVRAGCEQAAPDAAQACDAVPLAAGAGDDLLPAWSPDGRLLAFTTSRYGNPELAVTPAQPMAAGLQQAWRLTDDPSGDWRPAWLPDSRRLVWASGRSGRNGIYRLAVPPGMAPAARIPPAEPLVVDSADNRDPAVSRTEALLFLSDRDGSVRAYSLDLQYPSAIAYPATPGGRGDAHPAWIDDGGVQILLSLPQEGGAGIYRADPGSYRPLVVSPGSNEQPAWGPPLWSPDAVWSIGWLAHPE